MVPVGLSLSRIKPASRSTGESNASTGAFITSSRLSTLAGSRRSLRAADMASNEDGSTWKTVECCGSNPLQWSPRRKKPRCVIDAAEPNTSAIPRHSNSIRAPSAHSLNHYERPRPTSMLRVRSDSRESLQRMHLRNLQRRDELDQSKIMVPAQPNGMVRTAR